jgi:hypothetical protein
MDELFTLASLLFLSDDDKSPTTPQSRSHILRETIEDVLEKHQLSVSIKLSDRRLHTSRCKV